jgi:hypothetical protein
VTDHHVDRPGVYAQRCAQLTGPNRPIGSKPSLFGAPAAPNSGPPCTAIIHATHTYTTQAAPQGEPTHQPPTRPPTPVGSDDLVAMADGDPPDPIPNSAVKTPSAYDTAA